MPRGILFSIISLFVPVLSFAGPDVNLVLIPPVSVTTSVPLDIRTGILSRDDVEYDVRLYLDREDGQSSLLSRKCRLPRSGTISFPYSLDTRNLSGRHEIIVTVRDPSGNITRKSEEIVVIESVKRSTGVIGGAWAGICHWSEEEGRSWNDDIRKLPDSRWREIVQDMHSIGMDIIVIQEVFRKQSYVGKHEMTVSTYDGKAFYPSELYGQRMPVASTDPLEAIFSEADSLGMKVIPGIGLFAWFDFTSESLEWHKLVAEEIWRRYGHHRSFYAFYVSEESGGSLDNWEKTSEMRLARKQEIVSFFRKFKEFCGRMAPALPVMLSTNCFGVPEGADTYPELLANVDILCPFGFSRMPEGDLAGLEAAEMLRTFCDDAGAHLWLDLEAFHIAQDMSLYPKSIEEIALELSMYDCFEKVLCYQYPGLFNNPSRDFIVGDEITRQLYGDYRDYLAGRAEK